MKKNIYILSLIFLSLFSYSQTETGYVEVKGKIKENGKVLPLVQIDIYEETAKVKSFKSETNGKFTLKLDFDKKYLIEFSKKDFVTKKVSFDTHVSEKQYVWPYPFTIELFENIEGLDVSALKDPVTKISYSKEDDDFVFDIPYTKGMKVKINKIQAQMKSLKKNAYKIKIAQADQKFKEEAYEEAIKLYDQAIDIDPYTDYPDDQIMECERRIVSVKKNKLIYDRAIANADTYFQQQKYQQAKTEYEKANKAKPSELYPKNKIKEIETLLLADKAKQQQVKYNTIVKTADDLLLKKDYINATKSYKAALEILPNEQYPKTKIAEIETLLADQQKNVQIDLRYKEKITEGDRLLSKREYQISKNAYLAASKIKPSEQYPKDKIKEIDQKMGEMKLDVEYVKKIQEADALLANKQLEASKKLYEEASGIKPTESYPKEKVQLINRQLAQLSEKAEQEKEYSNLIKLADSQLVDSKYSEAKASYTKALAIKPSAKYPQDKIKSIDDLLANRAKAAAKEQEYQAMITTADAQLSSKKYSEAKQSYESALKLKPSEQYPKDKIKEITSAQALIAKSEALDKQYQEKISEGDKRLAAKDYPSAKQAYMAASSLKPDESYPKTQLSKIEKSLALLAAEQSKNEQYNQLIKTGDSKLSSKDYLSAKASYEQALKLKPASTYPQTKLKEIESALALEAKQKAKESDYNDKIKQADAALAQKNLSEAKSKYQAALSVKPKATYPVTKLKEIDVLLANQAKAAAKEQEYKAMITTADAQLSSKKYSEAKQSYESALKLKPSEQYPKDKIKEITSAQALIAKSEADAKMLEERYKSKIAEGDRLLAKREYQIAKKAYEEASKIKPAEEYPKVKLEEIKGLMVKMSIDTEYAAALKKGSDYITQRKYEEAKKAYEKALEIKPNESFPKEKIKAIDGLIAKAEKDEMLTKYKAVMAEAAKKFETKDYQAAKTLYQKALSINKTAQYPKDKIKEIDKLILLAANKGKVDADKKNKYSALIQKADNAFAKSDYSLARTCYKKALQIFSQQAYPKDKLKEIDKLLAKTKEVEIPKEIDFSNKEEKKKFISSMAKKYGEGVHEENYESKSGKKVRRIIVVKGGLADEYREVKQPWGATYFFKNGESVSRSIFFKETQK